MPWLRHFALWLVFVAALFRPAAAGAFSSAPDAGSQARIGAFELVAATLVGHASGATCGVHEGIGAAYDENASGYRFAGGGAAAATRALGAADIGLSGRAITALEGSVVNAGTTRIINVANIKAASPGALVGELRGALPNILSAARAEGVQTLQITGTFAHPGLQQFAASQAARYGGTFSSSGGMETLTFILR